MTVDLIFFSTIDKDEISDLLKELNEEETPDHYLLKKYKN